MVDDDLSILDLGWDVFEDLDYERDRLGILAEALVQELEEIPDLLVGLHIEVDEAKDELISQRPRICLRVPNEVA